MGVDVPDLDDRGYADLLADARKRIHVHSKEWTDHNAHDPGITLLETLVWVAETARYRLNRVTDAHVLKYLWLLGVRPLPPEPAEVELAIDGPNGGPLPDALAGVTIPAGESLVADDGSNEPVQFETIEPVTLSAAELVAVETRHRGGTTNNADANRADGVHFLAFGPAAEHGSRFTLGFQTDPFEEVDEESIDGDDGPFATLDLSITVYDDDLPQVSAHEAEESVFEPSVELEWQFYAATDTAEAEDVADDPEDRPSRGEWRDLTVVRDETLRLYNGGHGHVTLRRPADWSPADWHPRQSVLGGDATVSADRGDPEGATAEAAISDTPGLVALRCRVVTPGYEIPPRIDRVGVNTVEAQQRSTREGTLLHQPDGRVETSALPGQTYLFPDPPVLSADVVLVSGTGNDERREAWTEVDDLDASRPDDRHYVLDHATGELRFGDNRRGAVPPVGRRVVAAVSIHGGGVAGNVPSTADWSFDTDAETSAAATGDGTEPEPETDVTPPWWTMVSLNSVGAATGGADAETVDAAVARLQREQDTPYRTVTPADYRELAKKTPGIRVARSAARVLPGAGPDGADVTRVTVMPYSTLPKSVDPAPSRGFLAAVEAYLASHRLLTDRIEVAPPKYIGVGVTVEVRIVPGYSIEGRQRAIEDALDGFLDPLDGYDDDGWPFGRPVYKSELYGVVKGVHGVDWVIDISVYAEGHEGVDADGNVLIDESGLVRPLSHDVSVRFRSETTGVDV